jgi:hypothetical protein
MKPIKHRGDNASEHQQSQHFKVPGGRASGWVPAVALSTLLTTVPHFARAQEDGKDAVPTEADPMDEAGSDAADESEATAPSSDEAAVESASAQQKGHPSPLDVSLGLKLYSRAFRYTDTLAQQGVLGAEPLTDYNLDFAPMPGIKAHWYPFASSSDGFVSHLGLTAGFEMGVGTSVNYQDPVTLQTAVFSQSHLLYYAGFRGRIPIKVFTLGINANFGQHSFKLSSKEGNIDPETIFPNVTYTFVEAGVDGEFRIGRVMLGGEVGAIIPLSTGNISSDAWFPQASAFGVHTDGHVGFELSPKFDLLGGIDARMYGFNFNPIAPDAPPNKIAGGATDHYISVYLALRFRLPEVAGGASSGGSEKEVESDGGFDSFD